MNYSQILKRSWEILKNNKFLWGLGILAGLVSGGGGIPSFNFPSNFESPQPTPAIIELQPTDDSAVEDSNLSMAGAGRVLGEAIQKSKCIYPNSSDKSLGDKCDSEPELTSTIIIIIISVVLVVILVWIILLYFGLSARAGMILAVDKLETTGEKMTFSTALRAGRKYFWPIFGSGLMFFLYTVFFVLIIGALVLIGWFSRGGITIGLLVILGILLFLLFLVSVFYLSFLFLFVSQLIVLDQLGPVQAIIKAHALVKRNWRDVILSWVIIIGVGMVAGLAIMLAVFIVLAVFVLLGFGLYFAFKNMTVIIVYGSMVGLVLFVAMLFVRGIVTAYVMIFTTLVYRALRYIDNQKGV